MQILVRPISGTTRVVQLPENSRHPAQLTVDQLHKAFAAQQADVAAPGCHLTFGGRLLLPQSLLAEYGVRDGSTVSVLGYLLGGKGGFGAMLRGIGRTGKLTDNFDACRDLNGRRIRYQEGEKKLEQWLADEKERELEKVAQAHIKQKMKEEKQQQLEKINEEIAKEVQQTNIKGVRQAVASGLAVASGSKRAAPSASNPKQKKALKVWGMEDVSDSDDSDSDEEDVGGGQPGVACPAGSSPGSGQSSCDEATIAVKATPAEIMKDLPSSEQPSVVDETCAAAREQTLAPATAEPKGKADAHEPLDLSSFTSAEELQSVGLDVLKAELQRHGLKAGGTLEQRSERLFLLRSTPLEKLDRSLFAKK